MNIKSGKRAVVINAIWFGHSFLWNSIHPIVLPMLLLEYGAATKNTSYGLLTFIGLMIALVVQPLSGALSDHTAHRLGRRRPWILAGVLSGLLWLALLASGSGWGLAVGYLLLQVSSNVAQGPAQGLIPDLVPHDQRGLAAGAKSLIEMLAVIAASLVISRLADGDVPAMRLAILTIGLVWLAAMLVTVLGAREESTLHRGAERMFLSSGVRDILSVRLRGLGDYGWLLLSRYGVLLGTYVLQSFGLYYFADVLHLPSPARSMGNMMTMIGVSVLVAALPAGLLSERFGRKRLSLIAIVVVILGMAAMALLRHLQRVWFLGIVIGLGMGVFSTVNWAWATDLVPSDEAAKYLGISNLATAGAAATSRLVGPLIDLFNGWRANSGYSLLFIVALIGTAMGLVATLRIREQR